MANYVPFYRFHENSELSWLDVEYRSATSLRAALQQMGVKMESVDTIHEENHSLKKIMEIIHRGGLLIVWVDCYYLRYRPDIFQKESWAHTIVIYGIDAIRNCLLIVDHDDRYHLTYRIWEISFSDFLLAHQAALRSFMQIPDMEPASAFFYEDVGCFDRQRVLLDNLNQFKIEQEESLSSVNAFHCWMESVCECVREIQMQFVLDNINQIVLAREGEIYKMRGIDPLANSIQVGMDLCTSWRRVRNQMARLLLTQCYDSRLWGRLTEQLVGIAELEDKYHQTIPRLNG